MSKINWKDVKVGTKYIATISGQGVFGKITKDSRIYLCQDMISGGRPNDGNTLEYKNSWCINKGTEDDMEDNSVSQLMLETDENFEQEKSELISLNKNGIYKSGNHILNYTRSPFGNCQNLAIHSFDNLIRCQSNKIISKVFNALSAEKRFAVLDIRIEYLKKLPKDDNAYVFKTPYTNTNGTKMCILGVKNKEASEHFASLKD